MTDNKEDVDQAKTKEFKDKRLHEIDPDNYVEYFRKFQDMRMPVTPQVLSNYLNHKEALERIANYKPSSDSEPETYHIVLEDDTMLLESSYRKLKSALKNFENIDILFLSLLSNVSFEEVSKLKQVQLKNYFDSFKVLAGIDSYVIK